MREKFRNPLTKQLIHFEKTIHRAIKVPIEVYYEDANSNPEKKSYFYLVVDGDFITPSLQFKSPVEKDDQIFIAKRMIESFKEICDFSELEEEEKGSLCPNYELDSCNDCLKYQSEECLGPMYSIPSGCYDWNIPVNIIQKYNEKKYNEFLLEQLNSLISRVSFATKKTKESVLEMVDALLK